MFEQSVSKCGQCCRAVWCEENAVCKQNCARSVIPLDISVSINYLQLLLITDVIVNNRITSMEARISRHSTPSGGNFVTCENSWTPTECSSTPTWSACLANLAGPRFRHLHREWWTSWRRLLWLLGRRAPLFCL